MGERRSGGREAEGGHRMVGAGGRAEGTASSQWAERGARLPHPLRGGSRMTAVLDPTNPVGRPPKIRAASPARKVAMVIPLASALSRACAGAEGGSRSGSGRCMLVCMPVCMSVCAWWCGQAAV